MKKMVQGPLLLAMLLMSGIATASEITSRSLEQLMQLSGINKQVADIPGGVLAGMQQSMQQGAPLSDKQYANIEKAVSSAFQAKKITKNISSKLKQTLSEEDAGKLLSWYQSDLGKKITKAEENASTPGAYQEMINQAQTLLADKERVEIAKRIDNLVNATEMTVEFQKNTAVTVYSALSKAMNPGQTIDIDAFKEQLAADEANMRQQAEQLVILSFVYSYKDIGTAEIDKYIAFLSQPNTKKFNDNAIDGMKLALNESIKLMAKSLAKIFTAQK